MQKTVLPNGLKILFDNRKGTSVVIQVMINVGSNMEMPTERGISHFLEHIVFEGTTHRPTNREITNEIEKIGGEFNAYTTGERTCFYIKVLRKHFSIAVEVLSDILQYPLFSQKDITKEKHVVIKEMDMVNDEPRFYQWILFQRHLFEKHPGKYPTYGNKKVIEGLTREKVVRYFQKYYHPNNMTMVVVGDVPHWKQEIGKWFTFPRQKVPAVALPKEPLTRKDKVKREKRDISNTYTIVGFKTVPRTHHDSYVLEVINGILGRGQSGRMFTEIRTKKGLAYEVGTQHVAEVTSGYFAVYASCDKKNLQKVKSLLLKELLKLQEVSEQDLQEAKDFIEGSFYLDIEDGQKLGDQLLFWQQAGDAQLIHSFIHSIKKVSVNDVRRVAKQYFKNHTMVVLEGK